MPFVRSFQDFARGFVASPSRDRRAAAGLVLAALTGAAALPALAQERSPAARESLADLAYTLGQAHALRTRCGGEGDQVWRARMVRMVELEKPDSAFRDQLFENFNTGFLGAKASHPRCDVAAQNEAGRVAARGRDLARVLAGAR
jgi:uncharacterized protein (TIGR02301 family)